ncbi:hypothetical protein DFH11DRAFT_1831915 [Phellopilus nigrolimitatus]|nr:hypothetical protein DFH11DRAFT_1831915 [Phellopilus nigrolimitatus]
MNRSCFAGDDSDDMPFIPFPDDAAFNLDEYQDQHKSLEWQSRVLNADLEAILLETIKRLHWNHDIPIASIEDTSVLPDIRLGTSCQSKSNTPHTFGRDLLQWQVFPVKHSEIPKHPLLPDHSDILARLESTVNVFCPNLNCIEAFCSAHETNPGMGPPARASINEKLSGTSGPCGLDCHMLAEHRFSPDEKNMPDDFLIQETASTILSVLPDLTTCRLAVACRRTCTEVLPRRGYKTRSECAQTRFSSDDPCNHAGPCDGAANCPCYLNKTYCEKSCRCSPRCRRKYRGCSCKISKLHVCTSDKCPCARAGRECDPEVCGSCKPSSHGFYPCRNSQIQCGKRKAIRHGEYGLGLFAAEKIFEHDLIVEYVGEIIFEPTVESRECVRPPYSFVRLLLINAILYPRSLTFLSESYIWLYRKRNYLFSLNTLVSIDASPLGNEARFINHGKMKKANCEALCRLVNGEQRIGIFATKHIKAGTELLLNYGDYFFVDSDLKGKPVSEFSKSRLSMGKSEVLGKKALRS